MSSAVGVDAPEIPQPLIDRLRKTLGSLQMLPEVAREALQIVNSPDCDLVKVATVVQRDLKLATFILRLANSTLLAPPKPIASLHHAVLFIGRRRARDFIITASMDGVASKMLPELEARLAALWLHGFLTGILAAKINDLLKLGFQGEEFTAGLMHDFGRTLIAIADKVNIASIDPLDFLDPPEVEDRERRYVGASHAEVGSWFAAQNDLPPELVAAIQFHHRPEDAGPNRKLATLLAAADHAANYLQSSQAERYNHLTNGAVIGLEQLEVRGATKTFAAAIEGFLAEAPGIAVSMLKA